MNISLTRLWIPLLLSFAGGVHCLANEVTETPAWAENIHLTVFGGLAKGDIEISLNGEFAAEIQGDPSGFTPIGDMLVAGINTMKIRLRPAETPRENFGAVRIQISPVVNVGHRQRQTQNPIVSVTVPKELRGGGFGCTQVATFWAGPPPSQEEPAKARHWLLVQGAPSTHWFTVFVNGAPVFSGPSGDSFYEISDFVMRGKNEVLYSASPTCMSP